MEVVNENQHKGLKKFVILMHSIGGDQAELNRLANGKLAVN
jgi:hypothetical protein